MIKVAVSRCLLGEPVRYDGTAKPCQQLELIRSQGCEIVPFCPEVAIGMGVPRLPIQLDVINNQVRARRKNDPAYDYTDPLIQYANDFADQHNDLIAIINKRSSPSCGYKSTKLFLDHQIINQQGTGVFIATMLERLPALYLIDEEALIKPEEHKRFIEWLKQKALQEQG